MLTKRSVTSFLSPRLNVFQFWNNIVPEASFSTLGPENPSAETGERINSTNVSAESRKCDESQSIAKKLTWGEAPYKSQDNIFLGRVQKSKYRAHESNTSNS